MAEKCGETSCPTWGEDPTRNKVALSTTLLKPHSFTQHIFMGHELHAGNLGTWHNIRCNPSAQELTLSRSGSKASVSIRITWQAAF